VATKLEKLSSAELEAELAQRERQAQKLAMKRDKILARVAEIDAELDQLGYEPIASGRGRRSASLAQGAGKRPSNRTSLAEALGAVLEGKTMGISEAADAVRKAGYRSSSSNFRNIVNQTLLKHPNLFKKVGRGKYTAATA